MGLYHTKKREKEEMGSSMRRGWPRRPRGLLTRLAQWAVSDGRAVHGGSSPRIEPGLRVEVVGFPALPEPFARILDFDALEREAARDRQGATGRPQARRTPKALREYLKPGVTRTEELILTAELSRIGTCRAVRPGRCGRDRREAASGVAYLSLAEGGLEVSFA